PAELMLRADVLDANTKGGASRRVADTDFELGGGVGEVPLFEEAAGFQTGQATPDRQGREAQVGQQDVAEQGEQVDVLDNADPEQDGENEAPDPALAGELPAGAPASGPRLGARGCHVSLPRMGGDPQNPRSSAFHCLLCR